MPGKGGTSNGLPACDGCRHSPRRFRSADEIDYEVGLGEHLARLFHRSLSDLALAVRALDHLSPAQSSGVYLCALTSPRGTVWVWVGDWSNYFWTRRDTIGDGLRT